MPIDQAKSFLKMGSLAFDSLFVFIFKNPTLTSVCCHCSC